MPIKTKNLTFTYTHKNRKHTAVNDITLEITPGETFGLVGESGCGKSTFARLLLKLLTPDAGIITFDDKPLELASPRDIQMIFQDASAALNPRMTAGEIIEEPLLLQTTLDKSARQARIHELLTLVNLSPEHIHRYPHEFSGGQKARIGIARALALNPCFIICDEPIAALDVSIQAQIVTLLQRLQKQLGLTYLFISHDLSMVRHICNRIAVMYQGKIVELATTQEHLYNPQHPYSKTLLSAMPEIPQF